MNDWESLVYETAERFGGNLPHPETSTAIGAVYARAPIAVARAIDRVALEFENGTARSPWGLLKSRVEQITTDAPKRQRLNERGKAVERAEQWLKNCGIHFDRASEIEQELFGTAAGDVDRDGRQIVSSGEALLKPWADDAELRRQMLALWSELRPIGEQIEREEIERAERYIEQRAAVRTRRARPIQNLEPEALRREAALREFIGAEETR